MQDAVHPQTVPCKDCLLGIFLDVAAQHVGAA